MNKILILSFFTFITLAGCSAKQHRRVEHSGFLGDYSQLQSGKTNEALYIYVNPDLECKTYTKAMIDPVTLWTEGENSDLAQLPEEDQNMLMSLAWGTIYDAMRQGGLYIVQEPGPDVLRVKAAVTEAAQSNTMIANTLAVAPYAWVAATLWGMGSGKWPFLGELAGEIEILDSVSNTRILAGVDKVAGRLGGNFDPMARWNDVVSGFQLWRDRMGVRMANCKANGTLQMPDDERFWIEKTIDYVSP
jgi:hypothetical protein